MEKFLCNCKGIEINLSIYTLQELTEEVHRVKRKECFNTDKSDVWNRVYHVMEKAITSHTFKTSQNGDIQWIWSGGWEWWAVSGVIGRWSWFCLHIYAEKYVYFWILQCWLTRHWGAGVIHASSRQGYLKKISRIELCMVDKGFGGRQYQKTTLALNPKRDLHH
jgi:hypothetical protein